MKEITTPVSLTHGLKLNREAVGFTRRPLIDTSGLGSGWGRNKRWEYWCVLTPDYYVSLTVSDVDYVGLNSAWIYDKHTGQYREWTELSPFGAGVTLPPTLDQGPAHFANSSLGVRVDPIPAGNRLRAYTPDIRFDITAHKEADHESLGVVVPWSDMTFQYTVKDVVRPATGTIIVDGATYTLPENSWAILDHGRGRWPYSMRWNWGAGVGRCESRLVGLQVGGRWTDGTGSVENSLWVDGTLHIIDEELVWDYDLGNTMAPWTIRSPSVDLTFTPHWDRHAATDVTVIRTEAHQCFGHYRGTVNVGGASIRVDVPGFAEDVNNRW